MTDDRTSRRRSEHPKLLELNNVTSTDVAKDVAADFVSVHDGVVHVVEVKHIDPQRTPQTGLFAALVGSRLAAEDGERSERRPRRADFRRYIIEERYRGTLSPSVHPSSPAQRVTGWAVAALPPALRAEWREDLQRQLHDLAASGATRRSQLRHAVQSLWSIWRHRAEFTGPAASTAGDG